MITAAAPAAAERDDAIAVEVGGARVLVRAGFDRAALAELLEVLRRGAT